MGIDSHEQEGSLETKGGSDGADNVDVAGLSVAGLSIGEILNGHLGKCPLRLAQWTLK